MNIEQKDIDRISKLLDKYYQGETDCEEGGLLTEFFKSVDPECLPESLRGDAELFRHMSADLDVIVNEIPVGLEDRIRSIMDDEPSVVASRPRRLHIMRFAPWTAAAAAVALLIAFGMMRPPSRTPAPASVVDAALLTAQPVATDADTDITVGSVAEEMKPVEERLVADNTALQTEREDYYLEITNPDQAAILAQDAFAMIRDKLAIAKYSMTGVSNGMNQISETMRDVIID